MAKVFRIDAGALYMPFLKRTNFIILHNLSEHDEELRCIFYFNFKLRIGLCVCIVTFLNLALIRQNQLSGEVIMERMLRRLYKGKRRHLGEREKS